MGRPEGAVQHMFTQGDGVGEVGRRCQKKHVVEGKTVGVGERKQNKRQTQEIIIQVDLSMCDASRETGCHLHMMTKPLVTMQNILILF